MSGESRRRSETVLLVEDEDGVRDLLRDVLTRAGYTVLEARHASDAVAAFEAVGGAIDLLITDVIMPQMNGRELAQTLRSAKPDLRVLFMSGYADDRVLAAGIPDSTRFLQKPFTPAVLTRAVREVLDSDRCSD